MFFDDNTSVLRKGDPLGERLGKVAREQNILLMRCDQCALERGLAEGTPGDCQPKDTVSRRARRLFPRSLRSPRGQPARSGNHPLMLKRSGARDSRAPDYFNRPTRSLTAARETSHC